MSDEPNRLQCSVQKKKVPKFSSNSKTGWKSKLPTRYKKKKDDTEISEADLNLNYEAITPQSTDID